MGSAKNQYENEQVAAEIAMGLLIEVGAVSECPIHEGTYIDQDLGIEEALDLGRELLATGDPRVAEFEDEADLESALNTARGNAGDECGSCGKNARKG